jgi:hypothetical protein
MERMSSHITITMCKLYLYTFIDLGLSQTAGTSSMIRCRGPQFARIISRSSWHSVAVVLFIEAWDLVR